MSELALELIRETKEKRFLRLDIGECRLTKLPNTLLELSWIKRLVLVNNEISDIQPLTKLTNLNSLDLGNNEISDITPLASLINLESLDLGDNNISDITPLASLTNLNSLNLGNNKISDIEPLTKLTKLKSLYLRNNSIRDIMSLSELTNLESLYLNNNPINSLPKAVIEQGNQAILYYLKNIEQQGTEQLNEAKLIIVGEPGAGKTSLMKKLLDPDYQIPQDETSTLGIQVEEGWKFPRPDKPDTEFTTNIWDFGGQEIQYMTHQFFLTPSAVYILLSANDRKETKATFRYWFRIINLLGRDQYGLSPVLVVLNDKNGKFINQFDLQSYKKQYPDREIDVREVNLHSEKEKGYNILRNIIQSQLTKLAHVTKPRPAKWVPIRTALQQRAKTDNHINLAEYQAICKEHGIEDLPSQKLFSGYLHKLGIILHFWDDMQLRDLIILRPQWAVDAVYSVLEDNSIHENYGRFTLEKLESLWCGKYDLTEQGKLLSLMSGDHFEICYKLEGPNPTFIAPQLLNEKRPNYQWNATNNLKFRFRYNFMPEGIITRLIVRLHHQIDTHSGQQLVWRTGVIFKHSNCRALVEETTNQEGQDVIDINIFGPQAAQKELLVIVHKEIEDIHHKWFQNIEAEAMIPCICNYCAVPEQKSPKYFRFSVLKRAQERGRLTVECDKDFINVPVADLLGGVFLEKEYRRKPDKFHKPDLNLKNRVVTQQTEIFLSYSRKNEIHASLLSKLLEDKGYQVWWDNDLRGGEHFRSKIQTQLVAAKYVVVLWSEKSIDSQWVQEEASYAHVNNKLIPVLLENVKPPIPFGGLQTIDFCNWQGESGDTCLEQLLEAISAKI